MISWMRSSTQMMFSPPRVPSMMNNDIPAMKEVAKEVMQSISSEVNGKSSDITNGEMANGGLESSENGNKGAGGES